MNKSLPPKEQTPWQTPRGLAVFIIILVTGLLLFNDHISALPNGYWFLGGVFVFWALTIRGKGRGGGA